MQPHRQLQRALTTTPERACMLSVTGESAEHEHHIRLQDGRIILIRSQSEFVVIVTPRCEELTVSRISAWELAEALDWLATRSGD